MICALAALLAATAAPRAIRYDESVHVRPGDWRAFAFRVPGGPALVTCEFVRLNAGAGIRTALLTRQDAERLQAGRAHHVLAGAGFKGRGAIEYHAPAGEYALVIDNRLDGADWAEVHLHITITPESVPEARELSPQRRAAVIAASLALFCAIALFTGRRLWNPR